MRVRVKFSDALTIRQEWVLTQMGFTYYSRKNGEWVIYERDINPRPIDTGDLADDVIAELQRKVNRIVDSFANPEDHREQIRIRCTNLARTMLPKQRAWVMDWIRRVLDEDEGYDEVPWTDDLDQQELRLGQGFC